MRIQILILGFKGLKLDEFLKCIIKRDRKTILRKWSQDWNKHEHNSTSTSTSTRLNFDEPINYTYVSQIDIPLLLLLLAFLLTLRAPCGHVSSVQRQRRSSFEVSILSETIWRTLGNWSVFSTSFATNHSKEICAYSLLLMSTVRITKILASDNATVDQEADVHVLVVDLKHVTYWEEKRRSLADRKSA